MLVVLLVVSCGGDGDDASDQGANASAAAERSDEAGFLGEVTFVQGDAERRRGDNDVLPVDLGIDVASGDRIATAADSEVEVTSAGVGRVTVRSSTVALFDRRGAAFQIDVNDGGVFARAAELASGARLEVRTPALVAGVRGTEFDVEHDAETGVSVVEVAEGSVVILPAATAGIILQEELGDDEELLERVTERLYATATIVEENQLIVVGPEQIDALQEAAGTILDIVRELSSVPAADVDARIDEIGDINESATPILTPEPLPPSQQQSRTDAEQPEAPAEEPDRSESANQEPQPPATDTATPPPADTPLAPAGTEASADTQSDSASTSPDSAVSGNEDTSEPNDTEAVTDSSGAGSAPVEPVTSQRRDPAYVEAMGYPVDARVASMYYTWFGNVEIDGALFGWDDLGARPPSSWASDYEPVLGLYSSNDPAVIEQHMQWLRLAGIGTIVTPWFGPGSNTETVIRVMEIADEYGIAVALRIEGEAVENPSRLFPWVRYLVREFATLPNYARTTAVTPSSARPEERPIVFVFAVETNFGTWRDAATQIRTLDDYPFLIAAGFEFGAVTEGTFDGLAFPAISRATAGVYRSAGLLPQDSIFIASITPGYARYGTSDGLTSRFDGRQMDRQIGWALNAAVPPSMVLVTSFNDWVNGTQIEPAAATDAATRDYGELGPTGYIDKTREIADAYLAWSPSEVFRLRLEISTTSDWSELHLSRLEWGAARIVLDGGPQTDGSFEWEADYFRSGQPIERAEQNREIRQIIEISVAQNDTLEFGIRKGALGTTRVAISRLTGPPGQETVVPLDEIELTQPQGARVVWFEADAQ